jgi:hypothetical protein
VETANMIFALGCLLIFLVSFGNVVNMLARGRAAELKLNEIEEKELAYTLPAVHHEINWLYMRVLKEFGYHDDHAVGEIIPVELEHVGNLIKEGYAEILVNSQGYNVDFEIPTTEEFDALFEEMVSATEGTNVPVQEGQADIVNRTVKASCPDNRGTE